MGVSVWVGVALGVTVSVAVGVAVRVGVRLGVGEGVEVEVLVGDDPEMRVLTSWDKPTPLGSLPLAWLYTVVPLAEASTWPHQVKETVCWGLVASMAHSMLLAVRVSGGADDPT